MVGIKPFIKNFVIYQGSTFKAVFNWGIDEDYPLVSECKASMQIRESISDPDVIVELSTENGKIFINLEEKRIEIKLTAADTALLHFEQAVYDLELEFPNGDRYRIVQGSLALDLEVTR